MARAPKRGLYPFENTVLRIKAQPIFKKTRDTWGRRHIRIVQKQVMRKGYASKDVAFVICQKL